MVFSAYDHVLIKLLRREKNSANKFIAVSQQAVVTVDTVRINQTVA